MRRLLACAAAATAVGLIMSGISPHPKTHNFVVLERAEELQKLETDSFVVARGNVEFSKGPMLMFCDSARYFPQSESFEAFGNVRMQQGDTLFVFADEINYSGPEEVAYLYADAGKKVRLVNRDVSLETDVFIYDLGIDLCYYTVGGVLTDKRNRLTSLEGEYVPSRKEANFYSSVHLEGRDKDTIDIYTDTLYYNTITHIAELSSPSEVINPRGVIFTREGTYDTAQDTAALFDRSLVVTPEGRTLTADTIYYNRRVGSGICYGHMIATDSAKQASIEADYGYFEQPIDSAFASGHLLIKEYSQEDTLYLHAGQINARRIITPAADTASVADTTHVSELWPRVRFYRSDVQGICDSMRITEADSTLRMYISPVVWSDQRQISGGIIELHFNDSTVDRARLPEYGLSIEHLVDNYYNQISGREMLAWFDGGRLRKIDINGNVELILFPEENDSTINKMVDAQSSYMTATFSDSTAEYIKMWPETSGHATPLYLLKKSQMFLPKFHIYENVRPLSPADVFIVPKEMDEIMEAARLEE